MKKSFQKQYTQLSFNFECSSVSNREITQLKESVLIEHYRCSVSEVVIRMCACSDCFSLFGGRGYRLAEEGGGFFACDKAVETDKSLGILISTLGSYGIQSQRQRTMCCMFACQLLGITDTRAMDIFGEGDAILGIHDLTEIDEVGSKPMHQGLCLNAGFEVDLLFLKHIFESTDEV